MKAKVFKYKFDGNTVVAPYMELEPYAENVYLSLAEKNKYGYENDDYYHVVCKIGNVYFSCGQYLRRILDMEGHREEAAGYCRNWISNTLQNAANGNHVSLLSIRVFEELGLDTAPLLQAREAYRKKQLRPVCSQLGAFSVFCRTDGKPPQPKTLGLGYDVEREVLRGVYMQSAPVGIECLGFSSIGFKSYFSVSSCSQQPYQFSVCHIGCII